MWTYRGRLGHFDGRLEESDVAVREVDAISVARGSELVLDNGPLVARVLGGGEVCFAGNSGPVWLLEGWLVKLQVGGRMRASLTYLAL